MLQTNELKKLEEKYRAQGFTIDVEKLVKEKSLIIPEDISNDVLNELSILLKRMESMEFQITGPGIDQWIVSNSDFLSQKYSSKCLIKYTSDEETLSIDIPQAPGNFNNKPKKVDRDARRLPRITCNKSTIRLVIGDIAQQTVIESN